MYRYFVKLIYPPETDLALPGDYPFAEFGVSMIQQRLGSTIFTTRGVYSVSFLMSSNAFWDLGRFVAVPNAAAKFAPGK